MKDKDLAHEIVQESFISVWERRNKLDINANIEYYILSTVRNKAFNHLKKKKSELEKMGQSMSVSDRLTYIAIEEDASQLIISKELTNRIRKTLDQMPKDVKDTFLLNREKGLTYKEIAEVYDVSVSTIEYRISKALRILTISLSEFLSIIFILLFRI